jgi:replication factor C small subunit
MGKLQKSNPRSWVEKYRPLSLDDIKGNADRIEALKRLAINPGGMPHLLLAGPPGTGKTSAARAMVRLIDATSEEMNASDERGIDIIKMKVKEYATTTSLDGKKFKTLIMDESDGLTRDAQNAMKEIMERSRSCKFFLLANDMDGIREAIRSRCARFWFDPISDSDVKETLGNILDAEGYTLDEEAGDIIVARSRGDLRSAINTLQMICDGSDGAIDSQRVKDILQVSEADGIAEIMEPALSGDFSSAKRAYTSQFKGYAGAQDFVEMVTRDLIAGNAGEHEAKVAKNLSLLRMGQGSNDYLQVLGLLARLSE